MNLLGISGSLRNARFGKGSKRLVDELSDLTTQQELQRYLQKQTKICAEEVLAAEQEHNTPFDQVYKYLEKNRSEQGLSNSEAGLAAGLWGALQEGIAVTHVGLSQYFPMNGEGRHLATLKEHILSADAILISGPVYFGDRGSLVQALIEFISSDTEIKDHLEGKLYGAIAVGAKRNGGQETQLIYQLIDMCNLNMLAVGNSHKTSAQYGGTIKAGDVGTAWQDDYGLETAIGTGRRIATLLKALNSSKDSVLKDACRIGVLWLQDTPEKHGLKRLQTLLKTTENPSYQFHLIDLTDQQIYRCIACDLCPTHHATATEYACVINHRNDFFVREHTALVNFDALILAAYSPVNRQQLHSVYQKFMERTRYLRRASYALGDRLTAPLIISEINSNQNLHIRMLTSLIRHHTILNHPLIAFEHRNELLNTDQFLSNITYFAQQAIALTKARLTMHDIDTDILYNPIGYHISAKRDQDFFDSSSSADLKNENNKKAANLKSKRLSS